MKRINQKWIKEWEPCKEAIGWWDGKETNPIIILNKLINERKYDWANWFIVRVMEREDYIRYAVYATEQVLDIFEKEYPNDNRPRQAIEAAKRCINDKSAARAAWAAAEAAWAAARAAMQLKILKYGMGLLIEEVNR